MRPTRLLVIAVAATASVTACDPVEDQASATLTLQGAWALTRISGGFAGLDVAIAADTTPFRIAFISDGTFVARVDTASALRGLGSTFGLSDGDTGTWFMTDVSRSNDTLAFTFRDDFLAGTRVVLAEGETLYTVSDCCDRFEYGFTRQ